MKLAIVYNPFDHKLRAQAYSYIYKGMFDALIESFDEVQYITKDCSALDISADVIFFWDPQSCHHITIDHVANHNAVKMEYMSDPHQKEMQGVYKQFGLPVHKLGAEQRMKRITERGVTHIVSPVRTGFMRFLGAYIDDIHLLHFPPAPWFDIKGVSFSKRKAEVLGNGCTWAGGLKCYELRKWAFGRPYISVVPHVLDAPATPCGQRYHELLYQYAGGLAMSEFYPVPKYYEMAAAGMVVFAQHHVEYEELGFKDFHNCIYVDRDNFQVRVKSFLRDVGAYEHIGVEAQKLMKQFTAKEFGRFIRGKAENLIH